jgi:hypothetical protein
VEPGKLKTHGDHLGEKVDSSDLLLVTLVVSATWLHILLNETYDLYRFRLSLNF